MSTAKCRNQLWYLVFTIFLLWSLLLYFYYSSFLVGKNEQVTILSDDQESTSLHLHENFNQDHTGSTSSSNVGANPRHTRKKPRKNDTKDGIINHNDKFFEYNDWAEILDEVFESEKQLHTKNLNLSLFQDTEAHNAKGSRKSKNKKDARNKGRDTKNQAKPAVKVVKEPKGRVGSESECRGRYIYIHKIDKRYNTALLENCRSLSAWTDMCELVSNYGLGAPLRNSDKVYSNTGWFATNQFMLEVMFHNRMKQYACLTSNSSLASAIFVPYYPGLDLNRYLWWPNTQSKKDVDAVAVSKWLREQPEWKKMSGRDHFMVAGRISWDFIRDSDKDSDWGNKLLILPETKNMTMLVIESSPWHTNDFAIPYPTYFHPANDNDIFQWQNRMRKLKRPSLFSFAGAPRPNLPDSIRSELMEQCKSSKKCTLLECENLKYNKCYKPDYVMKMFQSSSFCLQPAGDSFTRRSTFDSIICGCIPVFFHPGSAYVQYIWHLPKDYTKYSVFIPDHDIKDGKSIEKILEKISNEKVIAMREEVIRMIPRIIYADPSSHLQTLEDAFDVTIKGVLGRVETIRKEMNEGRRNLSTDIAAEESWKYNLFGTLGEDHEWDHFFARPRLW